MSDASDSRLAHAFLKGVARVPIEALKFDHDLFVHQHRPVSEKIVERLRTVFRREGCLRYDSGNWIDALVDSDHLASVLTKNGLRETDLHPDAQKFPLLEFGRVDCLQGIHRVLAASTLLAPNDRWWTVKLYSRDLPRDACIKIIEGSLNEQPYSDGEIFRKIRLYNKKDDRNSEQKWWARLTTTKQKDLRQLLRNPALTSAFDSLVDMPGLWFPIKLGTLHRLLTLRCDEEELLHYLSRISRVWKNILEASRVSPEVVDRDTVEKLELLAPSASSSDRELIEGLVRSGSVFRDVTDPTARETLLSTIISQSGLIPSLRSFFENLKYLEPCCNILKKIAPAKERRTIYQSLSGAYFAPGEQAVEYAEQKRKKRPKRDHGRDLWLSYVQLWAFCMRHFPTMTQLLPRKESGKDKPSGYSNASLWHHLGHLATTLGFKTEQALTFRAQNPYEALAQQLLKGVCPESTPDTGLVTRVASILKQTKPIPEVTGGPRLTREGCLPVERRCGRPFEDDFVEDKDSLFIPFIYESEPSTGRDISPFFVKRDMFLSFFGNKYEKADEGAEIDDDDDDDEDDQSSADRVGTSQEPGQDRASTAKIQELDGALREEKQQTDRLQKKSTQLEQEIDRLRKQLDEQTTKASGLEKKEEDLQAKYLALESSSTTNNGQLREEVENLKRELEKVTHELADTRTKLQEKAQELEDMRKEKDKWKEIHRSLSDEMDMELKLCQAHPNEGSLERDLRDSQNRVSRLEKELSEAKEDTKEKAKRFEDNLSKARKAAQIANEKAKQFEDALKKENIEAQKDRQAQEEARNEASEFRNALHEAERKAKECKEALDDAAGRAEELKKALDEAERNTKELRLALLATKLVANSRKRKLDDMAKEKKEHEEEISRLRSQVSNAENLYKQKDHEKQLDGDAHRAAYERLKKSLEERGEQTKHLEHEIQGLKEQSGKEPLSLKNRTVENRAILDLFLLSMERTERPVLKVDPCIVILPGKGMFFIDIPDEDCEAMIKRVLEIIKRVKDKFDLIIQGRKTPQRNWTVPYIKDVLCKHQFCFFQKKSEPDVNPRPPKRQDRENEPVSSNEAYEVQIYRGIVAWIRVRNGKKRKVRGPPLIERGRSNGQAMNPTGKQQGGVEKGNAEDRQATSSTGKQQEDANMGNEDESEKS